MKSISVTDIIGLVSVRGPRGNVKCDETDALGRGSSAHARISRFIKGTERDDDVDTPELDQFKAFCASRPDLTFPPELSELTIEVGPYNTRIDAGCVTPDGVTHLVDFKRSIAEARVGGASTMRAPLQDLLCTPVNLWALQLSLESILWEKSGRPRIGSTIALVLHPRNPTFKVFHTMDLRPHGVRLFHRIPELLREKQKRAESGPPKKKRKGG